MLRCRGCCGSGGVDAAFWDNLEKYTVHRSFVLFRNAVCEGVIGFICGLTEHLQLSFLFFFFQANFENVPYHHKLQSYVLFFFLKLQTAAQGHCESIRIFFFFSIIFLFFFKELHLDSFFFIIVMNAQTQTHKTSSQLNKQQVWHVRTIVLEWDVTCKMHPRLKCCSMPLCLHCFTAVL